MGGDNWMSRSGDVAVGQRRQGLPDWAIQNFLRIDENARMAPSIRDPEADRLARKLAALSGESMTEAIRTALAERLARTRHAREDEVRHLIADVRAIQARVARLPVLDDRPEDEILGYDRDGLPT